MTHTQIGPATRGFSRRLAVLLAACLTAILSDGQTSHAANDIDYCTFAENGMEGFFQREGGNYKGIGELSSRFPKLFKNCRAALTNFNSEQKGSTVQGTLRIETDEPATSFVLLLSMMPRGAKE